MNAADQDRRTLAMYERAARDHLRPVPALATPEQLAEWSQADAVECWRERCGHDSVAQIIRRGIAR